MSKEQMTRGEVTTSEQRQNVLVLKILCLKILCDTKVEAGDVCE